MGAFAKIFAVVNLVLAVVFLGAASALLGKVDQVQQEFNEHKVTSAQSIQNLERQRDDETNARKKAESQMSADATRAAAAEASLARLQSDNARLAESLNAMRADVNTLSASAEQVRRDLETERNRNDALNRELAAARDEARDAKNTQRNLDTELAAAMDENVSLRDQVGALERARTEMQAAIDTKNNTIAFANDRFGTGWQNAVAQTPINGSVTGVDNDLNIVIISVGRSDKVAPGHQFTVSRGKSYVGRLVIDKVGDNWASGHMVKDLMKVEPAAGDEVNSHL
jgi:septal ring factor EnvC (AmiA/AmiB activator)